VSPEVDLNEGDFEQRLQAVRAPARELTWQALVSAAVVSAVVAASYPYVVLKLGLGPNVSVVSAFLGAIFLLVLAYRTHGRNRLMNNIVQTAGTSAASTAFLCVVAAAVDLAHENPAMTSEKMNGIATIEGWPMFWWLTCAGGIGVLVMVLFRRHFIDDPKMVFADGVAAAETIQVLDSRGAEATDKLRMLGICALASAVVDFLREGVQMFKEDLTLLPDVFFPPVSVSKLYKVGIEWNLLSLGSGMLVGLVVNLSMLAATLVVLVMGPRLMEAGIGRQIALASTSGQTRERCETLIDKDWGDLSKEDQAFVKDHGGRSAVFYIQKNYYPVVLMWFMWPATALMVTSAITAVLLKWRSVVDSFHMLQLRTERTKGEDVSLATIVIGSLLFTVVLALVQKYNFGMSYLQSAVAVLCSLPLILVGVRVLGETNNQPISVMMNALQAVFGVFWAGSVGHNLVAAGMAGSCNAQGGGTIQDYKTGKLLGSTPRVLTWVQLAAVPIGAAAVAIMYPLLKQRYTLGSPALSAPTGLKIANMAVLLGQGLDALPEGALLWTAIAAVVGILLPVLNHFPQSDWMPSAGGFGFGLILPGTLNIPMAIGGILAFIWARRHRPSFDRYAVTVASGFIAGEALLGGLVLPVVAWLRQ
jgi:OPT family oligopeptide transporter